MRNNQFISNLHNALYRHMEMQYMEKLGIVEIYLISEPFYSNKENG